MSLRYLETYRIMLVILSGYFNRFNYVKTASSPEVYIGLIGFKTETLSGLFRARVSLYAIYSVILDVTLLERNHCINTGVLYATSSINMRKKSYQRYIAFNRE